jgi:hypothetical protein
VDDVEADLCKIQPKEVHSDRLFVYFSGDLGILDAGSDCLKILGRCSNAESAKDAEKRDEKGNIYELQRRLFGN